MEDISASLLPGTCPTEVRHGHVTSFDQLNAWAEMTYVAAK